MIGKIDPSNKDVTIIGGGFAGLISAYYLLKNGYKVTLHEKNARCGGLIKTIETPFGIAETAAHSFRSSPALLSLCHDLNLPLAQAQSKKKYILRDGKMHRFSLSIPETLTMLKQALTPQNKTSQTLAEWAQTYVGQAALDHLITPLSNGIYAANPAQLDQSIAMPTLNIPLGQSLFSHMGARKKTHKPVMIAPLHGMQSLVTALQDFIHQHPQAQLHLNSGINDLPTGNVILATDAKTAGKLTGQAELNNIIYSPMITATLFYHKNYIPDHQGIGVLYSAHEKRQSLGILFNSATFANRVVDDTYVSFTIMLGGQAQADLLQKSDDAIDEIIAMEMRAVLGIDAAPLHSLITRWQNAIPLYDKNLKNIWNTVQLQPGHVLFGNYTGQVSLRGMVDLAAETWQS